MVREFFGWLFRMIVGSYVVYLVVHLLLLLMFFLAGNAIDKAINKPPEGEFVATWVTYASGLLMYLIFLFIVSRSWERFRPRK